MRRRHAVIVDDERLARRELGTLLEEAHAADVHIVGEGASLEEAARIIRATDADLVFLDITLGRESGFDLLPSVGADVDVVFVTAHDVHTLRAFEINALDYLMKPAESARLALTIQRLDRPAPERAEHLRPAITVYPLHRGGTRLPRGSATSWWPRFQDGASARTFGPPGQGGTPGVNCPTHSSCTEETAGWRWRASDHGRDPQFLRVRRVVRRGYPPPTQG
jgi:CheY-like chemotaxis protein